MPRFSAAQFGKANLTLPQHLAGPLENLLDPRRDNFERIGGFGKTIATDDSATLWAVSISYWQIGLGNHNIRASVPPR
jgi:hypothetical protein